MFHQQQCFSMEYILTYIYAELDLNTDVFVAIGHLQLDFDNQQIEEI